MPYVVPGYWIPGYAVGDLPPIIPDVGESQERRGPPLLLYETLPLRTTRNLGDYAENAVLPQILGDLSDAAFPLIRLSATRYFAADHPLPIGRVYVDRQRVADWDSALEFDDDGHTWTVVRFAAPVPPGSLVWATGTGRRDTTTGRALDNPADAMALVSALAGRDDDWSELRAECSAAGIAIGGRIAQALSVRAQLDEIAQSVGAIWTPGMARLYPSAADPSPIFDLDKSEVWDLDVRAAVTDTADVLRLSYDVSDARAKPLHFIELSASPALYGGVTTEATHAWIRDPYVAETVGRPITQRLAGERYDVAFSTSRRNLRPGMWVRPIAHPAWPFAGDDPVVMLLAVNIAEGGATLACSGEYLATRPTIRVTAHSVALPDEIEAGLEVAFRNGIATFTLRDADDRPIAGAQCSLDGSAPKTTNAQGQVQFLTTAGVHEFAASAPGFVPFSLLVTL